MAKIPSIQIRQQYAKIGIDADQARMEISQPRATMNLTTTKPKLEIESPPGDLKIDQSKAWDALAVGGHLNSMQSIYSEVKSVVLQTIGRIASDGNYLAAIHKGNKFADIARSKVFEFPEFAFAGTPSYDNVDVTYTAHRPNIQLNRGTVNLDISPNRPQIDAYRGKLEIYLRQNHSIEIIPPQIDLHL